MGKPITRIHHGNDVYINIDKVRKDLDTLKADIEDNIRKAIPEIDTLTYLAIIEFIDQKFYDNLIGFNYKNED